MSKKTWWQPPRRFEDRQNERKVSWLELFYDLVYAACIGQITSHIAAHTDGESIGYAVLLFVFIYWAWINGTQYYELHGNDTVRTRWLVFLQMLAVGAVAISVPAAFRGNIFSFTVSFLVVQGIVIYLFASISWYDKSHIKLSGPLLLCYGAAFLLYGGTDVALGWPLRYSHSPAEVVDVRDVEALGKIITAIAQNW